MKDAFIENILLSSGRWDEEREYWLNKLGSSIEMSYFPSDMRDVGGNLELIEDVYQRSFPAKLVEQMERLCRQSEQGLYSLLLSGVTYLLHRYAGDRSIMLGKPADLKAEGNGIAADLNLTAIKVEVDENTTFKNYLMLVARTFQEAQRNSSIPFRKIVSLLKDEADSAVPHFKTIVLMNTLHVPVRLQEVEGTIIFRLLKTEESLQLRIEYDRSMYSSDFIAGIYHHLVAFFEEVLEETSIPLRQIQMLTSMEIHQIESQFNNTKIPYQCDKTIHELFENQAMLSGDLVAIWFRKSGLTYAELIIRVNHLAYQLREKGVQRNSVVAVMMNRSPNMLTALLAVLKSGGAYLPIDPSYPIERIKHMLDDSETNHLLTDTSLVGKVAFSGETIDVNNYLCSVDSTLSLTNINSSDDTAYMIYTSGSTGKPKGVSVSHRSVINFFKGMTDRLPFKQGKIIAALTTISFDIFVLETLLPLTQGLKVALASEDEQQNSAQLKQWLFDNQVEMLQATPSRMQLFVNEKDGESNLSCITEIMVGGEAFPEELLKKIQRKFNQAKIFNMYGPTETTIWSSIKDVTHAAVVNLGRPISNTKMYIVDKSLRTVPIGVAGELCIAGDGVAKGYWQRDELNADRFLDCPFAGGGKMYRTGDLARRLSSGEIEYLGRLDQQVKIRGYRIELGEVENVLTSFDSIAAAACVAKKDKQGNNIICAYYVSSYSPPVETLRAFMSSQLPEYMLPSFYITMEKLPYTPNGKVDRNALPDPYAIGRNGVLVEPPANKLEETLLEIWRNVLDVKHLGVNDDFFNVGGHSLKAVKLEWELEVAGIVFESEDIYRFPTVRKFANRLMGNTGITGSTVPASPVSVNIASAATIREAEVVMIANEHLVEPFNDLFYKECFYNSLFPVVHYYQQNILPILIQDVILYEFDRDTKTFKVDYNTAAPVEQVLDEMNIKVDSKIVSHSVVEDLKASISSNKPVIIRLDSYYASNRKDTYLKKHWPHSWLVIGFNDEAEMFCVIEHDDIENLTYEKCWVSYKDIVEGYNGYFKFNTGKHTYYEFTEKNESGVVSLSFTGNEVQHFASIMEQKKEFVYSALEQLSLFANVIKDALSGKLIIEQYADSLIDALNQIINAKLVEKYRYEQLSRDMAELKGIVDESLDVWVLIRKGVAKSIFAAKLTPKAVAFLTEQLDLVYTLERQYVDKTYRLLGQVIEQSIETIADREGIKK